MSPKLRLHYTHMAYSQRLSLVVVGFLLLLSLGITACGVSSSGGSGGASTASATTPHTTPNTPGSTGTPGVHLAVRPCKGPYASVTEYGTPNVVIDQATPNDTASAHVGDLVQVRLPGSMAWSYASAGGNLALLQPADMQDSNLNVCFWNFHAQAAGAVMLEFTGRVICDPKSPCANLERLVRFTVHVS